MKDAVLQRVKLISDNLFDGNVSRFSREINMAQCTLNNQILGKRSISSDLILGVLNYLPTISAEWLLRGKGEMLIKEEVEYDGSFADMDKYKVLKSKYEQLREDYESLLFAISGNARGKASSACIKHKCIKVELKPKY